jgi:PAS domain S-box-containing protein
MPLPHDHDPRPASPPRPLRRSPPLLLAALVFLAALMVSFLVADNAGRIATAELGSTFSYRARDLSATMVRRMAVYEEVLLGTRGYLRGSVDVSRADFADYYALLHLNEHFPGIEALGIASIVPAGQLAAHVAAVRAEGFADYAVRPPGARAMVTAISHIQPFAGRNLRAFGYDMFSEPVRRGAMEAARDNGRAAVTGRVTLVQEAVGQGGGGEQSGFLMYVPVYRAGLAHDTVAARRAAIIGWVYAPFRMNDLMRGVGGEHARDLEVEVYDGRTPDARQLLYRSGGTEAGHPARFSYQTTFEHAGRAWTVLIRSAPSLEAALDKGGTGVIAATGAGLGLLLALVVWLLASERRRALQLAGHMTLELRVSRDRIEADRERVRLILRNAYDAFIAFGPDGRITDWNLQACKLFGWREDEAIGRDVLELLPARRRDPMRGHLAAFARSGACAMLSGPSEIAALTRHDEEIPVEIALTALPTAQGHGITAFVRDIRPRKQAEERERQRQQRLEEARGALLRSQKLEALGQMTGGVAHDFNNILHVVSANVQLLQRSPDNLPRRLQGILDAVERGRKLTGQLLAFARRQPLHPGVVDLARLIERMDDLLHRAAGSGITIRFTAPPGLWHALVDPNQLENVLLNLVINARDAMDGHGDIVIALDNVDVGPHGALTDNSSDIGIDSVIDSSIEPGAYVSIAVRDTGSGMPPDVMERAFEPFFTTKPEGKGTGLGLAMAHGFIKQSGGHTRLASQPGLGTTVTLFLPRALHDTPDPMVAPAPH